MALSTPAQTNHYLLDEFKLYKGIEDTNTDNDLRISLILRGIEKYFNDEYGIYLLQTDSITETFSIENGIVYLPSDTISIENIVIDGQPQDLNDFYLRGHILKSKNTIQEGINNIQITYKLGFGFDNIPFPIKLAMFIMTDKLYEKIENNANLTSSFTDPVGGREVFRDSIPKEVFMLIAPYVAYNIG